MVKWNLLLIIFFNTTLKCDKYLISCDVSLANGGLVVTWCVMLSAWPKMVIAASVSYTPLYISVHAVSFSLDPDWLLDLPGFPTSDVMNHLVVAVILSRLDYCNSLVAGLLWSTVAPLQRVQNAAAWLVLGLSSRDHVSQALTDLQWLPVHYRIQYKLALMMYMAHTGQTTSYIKDAVTPISQDPTRRRLQSADYPVPRTQTQFGERAFCVVAGLSIWNSLPESLWRIDCTQDF